MFSSLHLEGLELMTPSDLVSIDGGNGGKVIKWLAEKVVERAVDCVVENASQAWECFQEGLADG